MEIVDLHMHSYYSDGEFDPEWLVALARVAGVELISLTDHDEIAGLPRMRIAAENAGIPFVTGVEITTSWGPKSIHVVGLDFDENNLEMVEYLQHIRCEREKRAHMIAAKLEKEGMPGAWEGISPYVKNPNLISRNHFATWMLKKGYVKHRQEAFDKWLGTDRPAFVPITYGKVSDAVKIILSAGGIPVLAHPGRYELEDWALQELLDNFKEAGGVAIEVTTGSHKPEHVPKFTKIALEQGFDASTGSDFHFYTSRSGIGAQGMFSKELTPVWKRFKNYPNLGR